MLSSFKTVLTQTYKKKKGGIKGGKKVSSSSEQNARSAYQVVKWTFLSSVAPLLFTKDNNNNNDENLAEFAFDVCDIVNDEIFTSPDNTMRYLFDVATVAAKFYSSSCGKTTDNLLTVFKTMWNCIMEQSKAHKKKTMISQYVVKMMTSERAIEP